MHFTAFVPSAGWLRLIHFHRVVRPICHDTGRFSILSRLSPSASLCARSRHVLVQTKLVTAAHNIVRIEHCVGRRARNGSQNVPNYAFAHILRAQVSCLCNFALIICYLSALLVSIVYDYGYARLLRVWAQRQFIMLCIFISMEHLWLIKLCIPYLTLSLYILHISSESRNIHTHIAPQHSSLQ